MNKLSTPSSIRRKHDRVVSSNLTKNRSAKTFSATVLGLALASLVPTAVADTNRSHQHQAIKQDQNRGSSDSYLNYFTSGKMGTAIGTITAAVTTYFVTRYIQYARHNDAAPAQAPRRPGDYNVGAVITPGSVTTAAGAAYLAGAGLYQSGMLNKLWSAKEETQQSGQDAVKNDGLDTDKVKEDDDTASETDTPGSTNEDGGEPRSAIQSPNPANPTNESRVTPGEDDQETGKPSTDSKILDTSDDSNQKTETSDSEQAQYWDELQKLVSWLEESLSTRSATIRPAAGSYMSNAWAANTMFQMNLNDRLGSYYQGESSAHQGSAWIRYSGSRGHLKDTTGELRTAGDKSTVMMGVDMLVQSTNARDQFTIGIMGGYGHYSGHTQANGFDYSTKGKVNGYSVGLYGTYHKDVATQHGFYADSSLLWNQFDNRVKGGDLPAEKYDSKGMTASLELGYNIPLADRNNVKYVLQPHAQVMYQNVRSENFRQADGTNVDFMNGSRVQTALGVRAAAHITIGLTSVITPHIETNWLHANKGYGVKMDNVDAAMNSGRNIGQVKLGVQGDMNRHVSLNVELFHNQGNAGYHETGGNVTAKYRF
ncbi:hypothetical protein GCM10027287_25510 [Bordetella muralis]